jgi:hypothetical protein
MRVLLPTPASMLLLLDDPVQQCTHVAKHIHGIQNMQLGSSDFFPLIGGKAKIPGATLNVFGAVLQQEAEHIYGHSDFAMLSSWLGPRVSGKIKEGGLQDTIEHHIEAAVRKQPNDDCWD